MNRAKTKIEAMRFDGEAVVLLDQRVLPHRVAELVCADEHAVAEAIREMVVRGAPALGITAAYGYALAARRGADLGQARSVLLASRPTAVNIRWALDRLSAIGTDADALIAEAQNIHAEDRAINEAIGEHGAQLIEERVPTGPIHVLTHCNTGALASGGHGTALGIVRTLVARGREVHVWVDETRPWLQGARLTAWELATEGIPCTLIVDSAAAVVLSAGRVDAIAVGCDRVARNGDVANKVGTLSLAVNGAAHGVPLYVAAPLSAFDAGCATGEAMVIEERPAAEVTGYRSERWAAAVPVYNPTFDVTPARWITAWITEDGPHARPPFGDRSVDSDGLRTVMP